MTVGRTRFAVPFSTRAPAEGLAYKKDFSFRGPMEAMQRQFHVDVLHVGFDTDGHHLHERQPSEA